MTSDTFTKASDVGLDHFRCVLLTLLERDVVEHLEAGVDRATVDSDHRVAESEDAVDTGAVSSLVVLHFDADDFEFCETLEQRERRRNVGQITVQEAIEFLEFIHVGCCLLVVVYLPTTVAGKVMVARQLLLLRVL